MLSHREKYPSNAACVEAFKRQCRRHCNPLFPTLPVPGVVFLQYCSTWYPKRRKFSVSSSWKWKALVYGEGLQFGHMVCSSVEWR